VTSVVEVSTKRRTRGALRAVDGSGVADGSKVWMNSLSDHLSGCLYRGVIQEREQTTWMKSSEALCERAEDQEKW